MSRKQKGGTVPAASYPVLKLQFATKDPSTDHCFWVRAQPRVSASSTLTLTSPCAKGDCCKEAKTRNLEVSAEMSWDPRHLSSLRVEFATFSRGLELDLRLLQVTRLENNMQNLPHLPQR